MKVLYNNKQTYIYSNNKKTKPVKYISPTSIVLNKTTTTIKAGATDQLSVAFIPVTTTNKDIVWTSSNTNVVTVANGLITGVSDGIATIICASVINNSIKSICEVTVEQISQDIEVDQVTLNTTNINIEKTKTYQLNATVLPVNATNKTITWSTSNSNVATVSTSGLVTAKSTIGNCVISATASNDIRATCNIVIIEQETSPEDLEYISDGLVCWLDSKDLTSFNIGETWSDRTGLNNGIISYSTGIPVVTETSLIASGGVNIPNPTKNLSNYTIEIGFKNSSSNWCGLYGNTSGNTGNSLYSIGAKINSYPVTSNSDVIIETPSFLSVVCSNNKIKLYSKCVLVNEYDANNILPSTANYLAFMGRKPNSNSDVSTEIADMVTAEWYYIKIYNRALTVDEMKVNYAYEEERTGGFVSVRGVTLNISNKDVSIGEEYALVANINPSYATNKSVTWRSSNTLVATVDNGIITAKTVGSATITATTVDGEFTATCDVTVKLPVIDNNNLLTFNTTKSGSASIQIAGSGTSVIDFGNGYVTSKVLSSTPQTISTTYTDTTEKTIKIDNVANITLLDCNSMNINTIDVSKATKLNKLVCYNNNISALSFTNNSEIQYIHCFNNPIVTNDTNLLAMINSLQDRSNKAYGSIIIDNRTQMAKVEPTSLKKDWVFGSAIMYNSTEWNKCGYHIKQLGVADIWESADYGDGITFANLDCGFDLNCQEFNQALRAGVRNFSTVGTSSDVHMASGSIGTHGNNTASCVIAQGISMYGVAPKCSYYLFKITNDSAMAYASWQNSAVDYARQQNIDVINMSYSGNSMSQTTVGNFYNANHAFVCSAGNSGANAPQAPGTYLYPITVGGIDSNNNMYANSSTYAGVDIVSYGVGIRMQGYYNTYETWNGTSYSSPLVAGVVVLLTKIYLKKNGRKPTSAEVYNELIKRTVHMGTDTNRYGVGRVQLMSYNSSPNNLPQVP